MRRAIAGLAVLLVAGCGGKQAAPAAASDPKALFQQFDQAMMTKQLAQVAGMIDFAAQAAAENPDFDTFPASQQKLILDKMREDTVSQLAQMAYPTGGLQPGEPEIAGDTATVRSTDGSVALSLKKSGAGWKIVGGLPGMTSSGG